MGLRSLLPSIIEQLLLVSDVTLITNDQEVQHQLGLLLVGHSYGSFVGLKLDHVDYFVRRS